MKSFTKGNIKTGFDAFRRAKMRNFWTMLGVIIGVASVIIVVGIGEGVKQQISGQIHHQGKDLITVQPGQLHTGSGGTSANIITGLNITSPVTQKDVATIAHTKGVVASAPLTIVTGQVHGDNGNYNGGFVVGTSEDLSRLLNQSMAFGAFLTPDDTGSNVAVMGQHAAEQLFDVDVPLGHSFTIRGQEFIVRGIFNSFSATPLAQQVNYNNAIFIPYDVALSMTKGAAPTYQVLAKPVSSKQAHAVAKSIQASLDKSHGGQSDLRVTEGSQNLTASDDILELLTRLIAGVAAISLIVGGIGIMNVMLVSVAERMHEIGIRKAVGATDSQILSQFIVEATVLSLLGGIIGVIVALILDVILRITTSLQPVISWQIILLATGVSLLVGIIFGSVPAIKAARKHPIEALRSE
jgi:putative ABC transport system permease protein